MKKLSVVFVTQFFPPQVGGAASRNYSIYIHLRKFGLNCKIITCPPLIKPREFSSGNVRDFFFSTCYLLLRFLIISLTTRYEILFISTPPITLGLLAFLGKLLKKIVIIDVQDIWPESLVEEKYLKSNSFLYILLSLCEKLSYSYSDKIITVSPYLANQIKQKSRKEVFILMSGTDVNIFKPKAANLRLKAIVGTERKKVILYSGKIGKAQSLENILFALAQVIKKYSNVIFLIVGYGEELNSLVKLTSKLGLSDYVKFLPPVSQHVLVDIIALSDICVVPLHKYEKGALPTKFFEYLSCEKPVLATSSIEIAKILNDSGAGIFVQNPEDTSLIADELLKLLIHDDLRIKMGKRGRRYILENFNFSEKLSKLISELF